MHFYKVQFHSRSKPSRVPITGPGTIPLGVFAMCDRISFTFLEHFLRLFMVKLLFISSGRPFWNSLVKWPSGAAGQALKTYHCHGLTQRYYGIFSIEQFSLGEWFIVDLRQYLPIQLIQTSIILEWTPNTRVSYLYKRAISSPITWSAYSYTPCLHGASKLYPQCSAQRAPSFPILIMQLLHAGRVRRNAGVCGQISYVCMYGRPRHWFRVLLPLLFLIE